MIADILNFAKQLVPPLDRKVFAFVNFDSFSSELGLVFDDTEFVEYPADYYFPGATRYTTRALLRAKPGMHLRAVVAPHIHESAQEAGSYLRDLKAKAQYNFHM